MSYYRMKSVEHLYELFLQMFVKQRVPNFIILYGDPGNASFDISLFFAKLINCSSTNNGFPCEVCTNCTMINQLKHPDFRIVFPKPKLDSNKTSDVLFNSTIINNPFLDYRTWQLVMKSDNKQLIISKDDIQQIIEYMNLPPVGKYKVTVIWMPEFMNSNASNSLLKILEDANNNTLFIMITNDFYSVLPTIVSRAVTIHVPQLSRDDMILLLKQKYPDEECDRIVDSFYGNASLIYSESIGANDKCWNYFIRWMRALYKEDYLTITCLINELSDLGRENVNNFIDYCSRMFQRMLYIKVGAMELVCLPEEEIMVLKKMSEMFCFEDIVLVQSSLTNIHNNIMRNANIKLQLFVFNPFSRCNSVLLGT